MDTAQWIHRSSRSPGRSATAVPSLARAAGAVAVLVALAAGSAGHHGADLAGARAGGAASGVDAAVRLVAAPVEEGEPVKFYRVRDSFNGEPEFLFAIAERFLGDGERNSEIFALNQGRLQPDGRRMTDPAVIEPGWILELPPDAEGRGVTFGPIPTITADPSPAVVPQPGVANPTVPDNGAAASWAPWLTPVAIGSTVLLAALIVGLLLVRRQRGAPASGTGRTPISHAPAAGNSRRGPARARLSSSGPGGRGGRGADRNPLPVAGTGATGASPPGLLARLRRPGQRLPPGYASQFDTAAAWTLDRALRVLATACQQAQRPFPKLYAVNLDAERTELRLTAPDIRPPDPWSSAENGRSWTASLRELQSAPVDLHVAVPNSRLVTLGTADGTRVLLDLGQAGGVIAVDGPGKAVRALGLVWAAELAASPWSDQVRVVVAGLADHPVLTAGDREVTFVADTRQALVDIGAPADPDGQDAPAQGPGVLFLTAPPSGADADRIQALATAPAPGWAVVVLDGVKVARWNFTLQPDGRLDTGALGIVVHASTAPSARTAPDTEPRAFFRSK